MHPFVCFTGGSLVVGSIRPRETGPAALVSSWPVVLDALSRALAVVDALHAVRLVPAFEGETTFAFVALEDSDGAPGLRFALSRGDEADVSVVSRVFASEHFHAPRVELARFFSSKAAPSGDFIPVLARVHGVNRCVAMLDENEEWACSTLAVDPGGSCALRRTKAPDGEWPVLRIFPIREPSDEAYPGEGDECPACGARVMATYVHGELSSDYEFPPDALLGGCMIFPGKANYACRECHYEW